MKRDTVLSTISAAMAIICCVLGSWSAGFKDGFGLALALIFLGGAFVGVFVMVMGRSK